jgi:hypothetical protein
MLLLLADWLAAVPAPSTPPTESPIQIIVPPSTSSGLSAKDFFVPAATLLGAVVGFGSATLSARLSNRAQDRRSIREIEEEKATEKYARWARRVEVLLDRAGDVMKRVIELGDMTDQGWSSDGVKQTRLQLKIAVSNTVAAGKLLSEKGLQQRVDAFCQSARQTAFASDRQTAKGSAGVCATAFDEMLTSIGEEAKKKELPA